MIKVPGTTSNTAAHLPPTALRARTSVKRLLHSRWQVGTERFQQFFMLPDCYRKIRAIKDCPKRGPALALDLLIWFYDYKAFPGHYGLSRLGEVDRAEWKYYYGSNYNPHQKMKLKSFVEPLCGPSDLGDRLRGLSYPRMGVDQSHGDRRPIGLPVLPVDGPGSRP